MAANAGRLSFNVVFEEDSTPVTSRAPSRSTATNISLSAYASTSRSHSRSVEADPVTAKPVVVVDVEAVSDSVEQEQPRFENRAVGTGSDNGFEEEYKDGICDCCNNIAPSCLMSFCCPCIMAGQIGEKIGSCGFLAVVAIFIILLMGDIFVIGTSGFTTCILEYAFLAFVVARLRGDMRLQFNLQARCNFWTSLCCIPCALAQMARQLYDYQSTCSGCTCSPDGEDPEP